MALLKRGLKGVVEHALRFAFAQNGGEEGPRYGLERPQRDLIVCGKGLPAGLVEELEHHGERGVVEERDTQEVLALTLVINQADASEVASGGERREHALRGHARNRRG